MRLIAAVLLSGLLSGCAAHQPPRMVSASWPTVQAIAPGTELAVYLGEQDARYGVLEAVANASLTIRGRRGLESYSRAKIERVAIRTNTGLSRKAPVVQTALIGGAISGALALFAKIMDAENPGRTGRSGPCSSAAPPPRPGSARCARRGTITERWSTSVRKSGPDLKGQVWAFLTVNRFPKNQIWWILSAVLRPPGEAHEDVARCRNYCVDGTPRARVGAAPRRRRRRHVRD